jgi:probable HAF family extracellular repeat protein
VGVAAVAALGPVASPVVTVAGASGAAGGSPAAACRPFAMAPTDLGTLGGASSVVTDMNDRGEVVGASDTPTSRHAFVWQRGVMTDLTPSAPPGTTSEARAINARGQVLINVAEGDVTRSVLWTRGRIVEVATSDVGFAVALNDRGQVVIVGGDRIGLWDDGAVTTVLDDLPGSLLSFADLSDRGHVAAYRITPASHGVQIEAFVWHRGTLTPLELPSPEGSEVVYTDPVPVAVDARGRVLVNVSKTDQVNGRVPGALLWDDGEFIDIGSLRPGLGLETTIGTDMNDRGQIVGTARTPGGDEHAFLWEQGQMTDLGTLPGDDAFNSTARKISNRGNVIGTSTGSLGQRAFVWACGTMVALESAANPFVDPVDVNGDGDVVTNSGFAGDPIQAILWTRTAPVTIT